MRVSDEKAREHIEYWDRYAAQRSISPWEKQIRDLAADLLDARRQIDALRDLVAHSDSCQECGDWNTAHCNSEWYQSAVACGALEAPNAK